MIEEQKLLPEPDIKSEDPISEVEENISDSTENLFDQPSKNYEDLGEDKDKEEEEEETETSNPELLEGIGYEAVIEGVDFLLSFVLAVMVVKNDDVERYSLTGKVKKRLSVLAAKCFPVTDLTFDKKTIFYISLLLSFSSPVILAIRDKKNKVKRDKFTEYKEVKREGDNEPPKPKKNRKSKYV